MRCAAARRSASRAGAVGGSSPEFDSGPIIPNSYFPINVNLANKKEGVDFSEPGAFPVPSATTLDPAFADLDGTSQFPFFVFDNADFAKDPSAPLPGSYAFHVTLTDANGAGYNIVAPYTVTGTAAIPLPAAVWSGMALLAAMPAWKKFRGR